MNGNGFGDYTDPIVDEVVHKLSDNRYLSLAWTITRVVVLAVLVYVSFERAENWFVSGFAATQALFFVWVSAYFAAMRPVSYKDGDNLFKMAVSTYEPKVFATMTASMLAFVAAACPVVFGFEKVVALWLAAGFGLAIVTFYLQKFGKK